MSGNGDHNDHMQAKALIAANQDRNERLAMLMENSIGSVRSAMQRSQRAYQIARNQRLKTLKKMSYLKDNPQRIHINNGLDDEMEMTYSDVKSVCSKNSHDNMFNVQKNVLAADIPGFIESGEYLGWRDVIPGKHPEARYFVYYKKEKGRAFYLCLRKMEQTGLLKPYAIIDEVTFNHEIGSLKKGKPPQ